MALESKSEKPPGELAVLPPGDADPDDNSSAGRMSFLDHLDELRKRLVRTVLGILAGFLIAFAFIKYIFEFIMLPLQQVLPEGGRLVYTEPAEAFFLYMKIAALAGLVLATPFTLTQVWLFISPGLFQNEKRFAIPFVVFSTMFFIVGALFSHYAVFPLAWKFFAGFSTDYMEFLPKIGPVFSLYVKMLLAMGIVFQLPTLIFFLARLGLVTPKFLIKNTKYAGSSTRWPRARSSSFRPIFWKRSMRYVTARSSSLTDKFWPTTHLKTWRRYPDFTTPFR